MMSRTHSIVTVGAAALAWTAGCSQNPHVRLEGFEVSRHWDEQIKEMTFEPGVRVHINAPSQATFDRHRPTQLILYALPNGNSIEWTIGRSKADGLDWHYYIQHIGAQTRRLREVITDRNIVVAYLEADKKSWPTWRREHENSSEMILALVEHVRQQIDVPQVTLALTAHSGGGSLITGYLNGVEQIPDDVKVIAYLDANYSFSAEEGHGTKLVDWLTHAKDHRLVVLAYDDREIVFNGKKVVGPTGGTYRATNRMLDDFKGRIELTETMSGDLRRWRGVNGQVDIIVHQNPANRILHTVLVGDMNGFIHAMTTGTSYENKVAEFAGPVAYAKWIQPD
jgi:hypothetical protein